MSKGETSQTAVDARACPRCGHVADHPTAVRQGRATWRGLEAGITDVGWRCRSCGHEWGFEMLGDPGTPPEAL